ncbi:MAG: ABC transporter permease subunit [Spirochaetales bacterium]|nr:ABC transporter permease subunit [Spirochaetales bacterium]
MTVFILSRKLFFTGGILFFILGWKFLSVRIGSDILLPSPESSFHKLIEIGTAPSFWEALGATTLRSLYGFFISYMAGIIAGSMAGILPQFRAFISPMLTILRTIPVLALILLAMLWFVTDLVPVFVCFLMVFPITFSNVLEGVVQVDSKLLQMGELYGLGTGQRFFHIILPSMTPFLLAGANAGLGMAWKVTIAAEVLSQPKRAVGSGIQWAQMNLETGEVLAWTAAAILLSGMSELVLGSLTGKFMRKPVK